MMKNLVRNSVKTLAVLSLVSSASLTHALESDTKKELAAGGSIITGALVAGPAGALAGAFAAAFYGHHVDVEDELESTEVTMYKAQTEIARLERDIDKMESSLTYMESEADRLEQNLLTRLEFQMLFRTGDDALSEFDKERLAALVDYLNRNEDLKVRLEGHADQRGTEEYNNLLSKYRAQTVADALVAQGISSDRIETNAFGSSLAKSSQGDYEGYALDRRVNVEVYSPTSGKDLAALN